jgi:glycosyltransferase involved in cell wall biosynthesis
MDSASLCVIIPAYNEQGRIERVVAGARKFVREVIVVDDGSTEETSEVAARAGATVVRHAHNCGKGEHGILLCAGARAPHRCRYGC